jgi:ribonuclease Z
MGEDYIDRDGNKIYNDWVTQAGAVSRSYAFCADTQYDENIVDKVKDVTVLYHESTYLDDLRERAWNRYHSTAKQAATIALKAGAGRLLLGHFSSKYEELDGFQTEAEAVFPNSELALEGVTYRI